MRTAGLEVLKRFLAVLSGIVEQSVSVPPLSFTFTMAGQRRSNSARSVKGM